MTTKYFYDTEFIDDGATIELISIGVVCEDGREYYAVNYDCDFERACQSDWLWDNVIRHIPTTKKNWDDPAHGRLVTRLDSTAACVKPKWVIANEIRDFLLYDKVEVSSWGGDQQAKYPQLWAYYGAYDHVALAQLWGPMINLPKGIPMFTHELMQLKRAPKKPAPSTTEHNALADARWNMDFYNLNCGDQQ